MADASSDFGDIVSAISTTGSLYPSVLEARAKLQREHPAGYDLTLIAHEVWPQLSDVAKVRALEMLFTVYVLRLHDEERDARLGRMEAGVALPSLFERYPDLHLAIPDEELVPDASLTINGLRELPVRLTH